MPEPVPVQLTRVVIHDRSDQQFLHLTEIGGTRSFPIVVGIHEAAEISRKLQHVHAERPMTHDLIHSLLSTLGWTIARVEVNDLIDHTFHAAIVITNGEEETAIDSRPSDAIALAVRDKTPIYVHQSVLDQVAPA